jgi:molybdopterin converting factor subunit 1
MNVTVRLFATIRQQAGWREKEIQLVDGATVAALFAILAAEQPDFDLSKRSVYAAVNQQYVQQDAVLADGDEVAIFPPVSGG